MRVEQEHGLTAGAEALVFSVLVFVVGSLLVVNGWAVLDARLAASAAAREATRTIVEAGPIARHEAVADPDGAARQVAVATLIGHGQHSAQLEGPDGLVLELVEDPWVTDLQRPDRCAPVGVEISFPVVTARLPFIGNWQTPIRVTATHVELTDPWAEGLAGDATC